MTSQFTIESPAFSEKLEEFARPQSEFRQRSDHWRLNDSGADDYFKYPQFSGYAGGALEIIGQQLENIDYRVGIDIAGGANGVALRGLIDRGLLDKGLVTNYSDKREVLDPEVDHIDGNIRAMETWLKIKDWQEENCPEGAALILHRPIGALQKLPPSFYKGATHTALSMLGTSGAMFAQIPKRLREDEAALQEVCLSIQERPDVAEVLRSNPNSSSDECYRANCGLILMR